MPHCQASILKEASINVPSGQCVNWNYDIFVCLDIERSWVGEMLSCCQRELNFWAFNYIYGCVDATASCVVLCHLLNAFCLPILLCGLEAVPISNANLRSIQSTFNVALYKIFKLRSVTNLYYVQYFMGTLPVNYALDLRKLSFLQKLSVHHTSVMNLLFLMTASKEFELLCKNYSITQPHSCLCVASIRLSLSRFLD